MSLASAPRVYRWKKALSQSMRSVGWPGRAVSSSQPVSVTTIVCSNCAERVPVLRAMEKMSVRVYQRELHALH